MSNASDKRMLGGKVDKGVRESVGIVVELLERQAGRQKDRHTARESDRQSVS